MSVRLSERAAFSLGGDVPRSLGTDGAARSLSRRAHARDEPKGRETCDSAQSPAAASGADTPAAAVLNGSPRPADTEPGSSHFDGTAVLLRRIGDLEKKLLLAQREVSRQRARADRWRARSDGNRAELALSRQSTRWVASLTRRKPTAQGG